MYVDLLMFWTGINQTVFRYIASEGALVAVIYLVHPFDANREAGTGGRIRRADKAAST
jgi:hypothetical protein